MLAIETRGQVARCERNQEMGIVRLCREQLLVTPFGQGRGFFLLTRFDLGWRLYRFWQWWNERRARLMRIQERRRFQAVTTTLAIGKRVQFTPAAKIGHTIQPAW